jgi:hypothetical protein
MSDVKECCKRPENLFQLDSDNKDLVINKCRVCGCRHFELSVDVGKFISKPTPSPYVQDCNIDWY